MSQSPQDVRIHQYYRVDPTEMCPGFKNLEPFFKTLEIQMGIKGPTLEVFPLYQYCLIVHLSSAE